MKLHWGLLALACKQWLYQWRQMFREIHLYGHKPRFILPWLWLKLSYLLDSPYGVSRRYQRRNKAKNIYVYGETPLTTLEIIATKSGVTSLDHVFELGAGSGFTSLWLRGVIGCQVTAIELIPLFCWRLHRTVRRMKLAGVDVRCANYLDTSFNDASMIYLYGSNLDDPAITKLATRLGALPEGVRIITISYALQPYVDQPLFALVGQFCVPFEWGEAEVFVQKVKRS